jgi:lauroyl/myristoyl acyltransferase
MITAFSRVLIGFLRLFPARWTAAGLSLLLKGSLLIIPPVRRRLLERYRFILSTDPAAPPADGATLAAIAVRGIEMHARNLAAMMLREEDARYARERVALDFVADLEKARSAGRGCVVVMSYFGPFAATLPAMAYHGLEFIIPVMDARQLSHLPPEMAVRFVTVGRSGKLSLEALARNQAVVVLPTLNFLPHRVDIPFFGRPSRTTYAPARLSTMAGCPILPVFTVRQQDGSCRALSGGLIEPSTGPRAVFETTAALTAVQERWIRERPDHWMYFGDPWNTAEADWAFRLMNAIQRAFG